MRLQGRVKGSLPHPRYILGNNREPSPELREETSRVHLHLDGGREPRDARDDRPHATRPEADCGSRCAEAREQTLVHRNSQGRSLLKLYLLWLIPV
jgi:hypothetical protein